MVPPCKSECAILGVILTELRVTQPAEGEEEGEEEEEGHEREKIASDSWTGFGILVYILPPPFDT